MSPVLQLSSIYNTPIFTLKLPSSAPKPVFGAVYNGKGGQWWFPAFYPVYERVLSDLRKQVPTLELSEEVKKHVEELEKPATIPAEFSFITNPYQHQIDGLLHAYRNIRAGLFYSPGLGKCKITVDLQRLTGDKMLIICPLVMLRTWADEFVKHGNKTDVVVIDGTKPKKLAAIKLATEEPVSAVITTYGVASLYPEEILKIPYDCIVADESHQMKTPFAKRTKAATALASRAYRRLILSGTPSLGSPFDMYGQLRFLGKYFCNEDWWSFRKLFGVFPAHEANEKVPKMLLGYKNIDLMNKRVNYICSLRTKEECLDLPDRTILDKVFGLFHEQKKVYNGLVIDKCDAAGYGVQQAIEEGKLDQTFGLTLPPHVIVTEQISLLNKVDQIASGFMYRSTANPMVCNGCDFVQSCTELSIKPYTNKCKVVPKPAPTDVLALKKNARLEECQGLLETILEDSTNKVIIWANFRAELNDIEALITRLKIEYVRVEGGVSPEQLSNSVSTFNTDPACRVYLGQVSTGIGITLNAANYMIYYNLPWSLEHYLQSLDRNYRIGQHGKVVVYRLIAKHTLDEAKAAALDQKMDFSKLVTTRLMCATCPDFATRCAKFKIQLFDDECKYDRTMMRETAKVSLIP